MCLLRCFLRSWGSSMTKWLTFVCLAFLPLIASAKQESALSLFPVFTNGHFEQTKTLKALRVPFVSRGTFSLLEQSTLQWKTLHPVQSELLINQDGIFEVNAQGQKTITNNQQVGQILLAILNADHSLLEQQFTIKQTELGFSLMPTQQALKSLFRSIDVRQTNQAQIEIILNETNDNTTHLLLTETPRDE